MDEVFNDLLSPTVFQKIFPGRADAHAFLVVVHQRVHIHVPVRAHVNVETCSDAQNNEDDDGVDAVSDYRAFAQAEVPYLSAQSKRLVTHTT